MADIKFPQDTVAATLADGDLFLFADVSASNALKEVAASDL